MLLDWRGMDIDGSQERVSVNAVDSTGNTAGPSLSPDTRMHVSAIIAPEAGRIVLALSSERRLVS
jgi:hypothetical protein